MEKQVEKYSGQSVGSGKGWQRAVATMLGFWPLAMFAYLLQVYSQKNFSSSFSAALFVVTLLLGSFAYDVLKSFLTLSQDKFTKVWDQVWRISYFCGLYLVALVILALMPTKNLGWFDATFAVLFFIIGLICSVCAIRAFVKAVKIAAE